MRSKLIGVLFGFITIGLGLVFAIVASFPHTLECYRANESVDCIRTYKLFGFYPVHSEEIARLQRAEIEQHEGSRDRILYRITLNTSRGNYPIGGFSNQAPDTLAKDVERINDFISNQASETLLIDVRLRQILISFLPLGPILTGIYLVIQSLRGKIKITKR